MWGGNNNNKNNNKNDTTTSSQHHEADYHLHQGGGSPAAAATAATQSLPSYRSDAACKRSHRSSAAMSGSSHSTLTSVIDLDEIMDDTGDDPTLFMSQDAASRYRNDNTLTDHDKMMIQRLACRKFFIPGPTSFWQDYFYWFANNHPFFCFVTADPRHPLGRQERIVNLLASLAFGLAATCSVVLWFYYEQKNFDRTVIVLYSGPDRDGYPVSIGMIVLMVFGGPLHVLFDLSMFFIQACPPCRTGGFFRHYLGTRHAACWVWIGARVATLITILSAALAIFVMLLRASVENQNNDSNHDDGYDDAMHGGDDNSNNNNNNEPMDGNVVITMNISAYSFLLMYLVEVFFSNFILFPIGTLTVFSGILGCCGRLPGLGGWPYQAARHERYLQRMATKTTTTSINTKQQQQQQQQDIQQSSAISVRPPPSSSSFAKPRGEPV